MGGIKTVHYNRLYTPLESYVWRSIWLKVSMILWSESGAGEFVRKPSIIYVDRLGAVAATAAASAAYHYVKRSNRLRLLAE